MKFPMVYKHLKFLSALILVLFLGTLVSAQNKPLPQKYNPPRLVSDYVSLLSPSEYQTLERKLVAYNDSTSIQIAIVLEETTEGEEIMPYAQRLAESWGIGQGNTDNGILILVTTQDRGVRIHTGYGAEGFLPDGMANRIIRNMIVPNFRAGDYFTGLDKATNVIMQLGTGEYQAVSSESKKGFPIELLFLLFVIIVIVISVANNHDRWDDGDDGGYYSGGQYEDYGRPKRRRRRGGWVITPGGGFGSGGGGGFSGGFGGFGGGSFGGGGASGSW